VNGQQNILIVAAHADDEVLGAGGAMAHHIAAGDEVLVLIAADCGTVRDTRPSRRPVLLPAAQAAAAALAHVVEIGLVPVLAHPERYAAVWDDIEILRPLVDGGASLLLDVAALAGKYGRRAKKAATRLVEEGFYQAACSDAHRPDDVREVVAGISELRALAGRDEAEFLLDEGPRAILAGTA